MKTKEAIEFMEETLDWVTYPAFERHKEKRGVIKALKRGEKFEKIVNELKDNYCFLRNDHKRNNEIIYLRSVIKDLEQKYFQKEE